MINRKLDAIRLTAKSARHMAKAAKENAQCAASRSLIWGH
jgi:hypothetical protein